MQRIAFIFGGRSVEHEVSVLTAHQAMAALPAGYTSIPVYIAKSGAWYSGEALRELNNFRDLDALINKLEPIQWSLDPARPGFWIERSVAKKGLFGGKETQRIHQQIDLAFPLIHGSHGEDGTLQGVFEMGNLAYTGCNVSASAIAIDKALTKRLLRSIDIPVLDDIVVTRTQWQQESAAVVQHISERFSLPVFIKPVQLGSSIGIAKAATAQELKFALDVATTYDSAVLVEPYQAEIVEINCSVLGMGHDARASVCEQPVNTSGMLSYEDKYMRGGKQQGMQGAERIIPAPLSAELTERIQQLALQAFAAINATGVVRIDFLVAPQQERIILNEINTLPGSLSFYLWEASELTFPQLITTLIEQAQARQQEKDRSTYSMTTNLLSNTPLAGSKSGGVKQAARS